MQSGQQTWTGQIKLKTGSTVADLSMSSSQGLKVLSNLDSPSGRASQSSFVADRPDRSKFVSQASTVRYTLRIDISSCLKRMAQNIAGSVLTKQVLLSNARRSIEMEHYRAVVGVVGSIEFRNIEQALAA